MNKINFYEVYYNICKTYDEYSAMKFLNEIKLSPININDKINDNIIITAGKLKIKYKMSLADSFGLAETIISNGIFVTADHHELDIVDKNEEIKFLWIR